MTADCASTEYLTLDPTGPRFGCPIVLVEQTFAAESDNLGRRSSQPRLFVAQAGAAVITRQYGCGGYAFGSDASATAQVPGPNQHASGEAAIRAMRSAFTQ